MLYYDRIEVSEQSDVIKTSESKECNICHYWDFLKIGIQFETNVWNRCHDFLMMSLNLSNIAILNIKSVDYCCIISEISKSEDIILMQNIDFTKKVEHYKI